MQSPYAIIIRATHETLTRRARLYRLLAVSVVLLIGLIGVSIGALTTARWPLALASALLVPGAVLTFAALDLRVVQRWRLETLVQWRQRSVDLAILRKTLPQVPGLPPGSLAGMQATLPIWSTGEPEGVWRDRFIEAQCQCDRADLVTAFSQAGGFIGLSAIAIGVGLAGDLRIALLVLALPLPLAAAHAWGRYARRLWLAGWHEVAAREGIDSSLAARMLWPLRPGSGEVPSG